MDGTQGQLSLRMLSDSSVPTKALRSVGASTRWQKSGRWQSNGECWTRNGSEYPNGDAACSSSLSSILEPQVEARYFLSPKACAGILRRSERRGKRLPEPLAAALENVVGRATPTA